MPAKQHNARQGDDTNYNFHSDGCTHMAISLPLPGTRNYISDNFSAELHRQIFWELFCSLAVPTVPSSYLHSPEVLRYPRQGLAVLERKQLSTLATCARRSVDNTGDKMAFTELILRQKVPNPLPKLSAKRPEFVSLLHISTFQELPGALWPSPISWGHLCRGQAVDTHTHNHSTEQLRPPRLHHSRAQM